jgi:MFS family permease
MAGAAVLGRLVTGLWIDRVFAARVLALLMALAAGGSYLLAHAASLPIGVAAAMLVGFGIGGESDVVPYLLSRYFGLRSFSALYGVAWFANAIGGALGPVLMGRAFDASGSYEQVLVQFAIVVLGAACVGLALPRYRRA